MGPIWVPILAPRWYDIWEMGPILAPYWYDIWEMGPIWEYGNVPCHQANWLIGAGGREKNAHNMYTVQIKSFACAAKPLPGRVGADSHAATVVPKLQNHMPA